MIYCLDTDILIEYFRGNDAVRKKIESLTVEDTIGFTWITIYEFFKGIFASGKLEEEKSLKGFAETCTSFGYSCDSGQSFLVDSGRLFRANPDT